VCVYALAGPQFYNLTMFLTDNGIPALSTKVVLGINIRDMNDPYVLVCRIPNSTSLWSAAVVG
jgi:hypothetical protein